MGKCKCTTNGAERNQGRDPAKIRLPSARTPHGDKRDGISAALACATHRCTAGDGGRSRI